MKGGKEIVDPRCKFQVAGNDCGGRHGQWFHEGGSHNSNTGTQMPEPLHRDPYSMPRLYEVYTGHFQSKQQVRREGMIMVDSGSDTDYIRHDFAKFLGLVGIPYVCRLKVVDMDYHPVHTARYTFEVVDREGGHHVISALGLGSITNLPRDPDLSPLLALFDDVPAGAIDRPQGEVDVLLGLRSTRLHGVDVRQWEDLRLLCSKFGCGWAVRGTHSLLQYDQERPRSLTQQSYTHSGILWNAIPLASTPFMHLPSSGQSSMSWRSWAQPLPLPALSVQDAQIALSAKKAVKRES